MKYVEARALDNNKVADLCNDLINSDFMQLKNDFERRNYIRSIGKEHPVTSGAVETPFCLIINDQQKSRSSTFRLSSFPYRLLFLKIQSTSRAL